MSASTLTLDPVLPLWLLAPLGVALAAFAVVSLVQTGRRSWILRLAMVLLLVVMALRPAIPATSSGTAASGGLEVTFLLDTTSSMAAEDFGPDGAGQWGGPGTRLDGAEADIAAIAERLVGAQFSLITFDSTAVQRVPLTSDLQALASATRAVTQEVTDYSRGSSIDAAVPLAFDALTEAAEAHPDNRRVLFYLGDGEQTSAQVPTGFASLAPLISGGGVLGYGTEQGGRMHEYSGLADTSGAEPPYILDRSVTPPVEAISRQDPDRLRAIASELGVGFAARSVDVSVEPATAGLDVGELTLPEERYRDPIEFTWLLGLPLAALALVEVLRAVRGLSALRPARGIRVPRQEARR